ncbi:MAG: hypothetical protein CBB65_02480 [Hyphomonadaceae bacterium TMED5]|nr:MAG: hypothetical protein CBB65_02480 [Hyphomonadaceae bacterium TMED5]|tara:strand:+ start:2288 stop:2803 length:516 start_codon:yes stop_codon:yes gene_type:complete
MVTHTYENAVVLISINYPQSILDLYGNSIHPDLSRAYIAVWKSGNPETMAPSISGRVLLAEDNPVVAIDLADLLEEAGAERVEIASSHEECIGVLAAGKIDFAILDIRLDDKESFEIAETLRDAGTPFIFISGLQPSADVANRFPNAGFLEKPFSPDSLLAAISTRMRKTS